MSFRGLFEKMLKEGFSTREVSKEEFEAELAKHGAKPVSATKEEWLQDVKKAAEAMKGMKRFEISDDENPRFFASAGDEQGAEFIEFEKGE